MHHWVVSASVQLPADPLAGSRPWRARLASIEAAAIAGVISAIGWSVGIRDSQAPSVDTTDADIVSFYAEDNTGPNALLSLQVVVVATISFRSFAAIALSVFAPRFTALVMLSTATLARATKTLPNWLILLSYALGVVVLVNVTVSEPLIFVFPAWLAVVSVVVLLRHPVHGFELTEPETPS